MESLDLAEIAKKLPPHLQGKLCPEFGTINIPQPNPLNPREVNISIQPMPCVGETCAKWDGCQGEHSPAAIHKEAQAASKKISSFIEEKVLPLVTKLSESRLLAGLFK